MPTHVRFLPQTTQAKCPTAGSPANENPTNSSSAILAARASISRTRRRSVGGRLMGWFTTLLPEGRRAGERRCGSGAPAPFDWLVCGSCRARAKLARRPRGDLWRLAEDLMSKVRASCRRQSLERRLAGAKARRLPSIRGPGFHAEDTRAPAGRERFPRRDGRVLASRLA